MKSSFAALGRLSDKRLKTNINFMYKSPSGINVYSFNYINDLEKTYQGVMAQELIGTPFQKAVIYGEKFMMVNYSLIDVECKILKSRSQLQKAAALEQNANSVKIEVN